MAIKTDAEKITLSVVSTLLLSSHSLTHESLTFILWRSFFIAE